jgi:hypothetical protein
MYFACLSVCNPFLRPQWNLLSVIWKWRVLLRQMQNNLSFSRDWSLCAFSLLLARRSSAVTHWTPLPFCLWRIPLWNPNPSLARSLIFLLALRSHRIRIWWLVLEVDCWFYVNVWKVLVLPVWFFRCVFIQLTPYQEAFLVWKEVRYSALKYLAYPENT